MPKIACKNERETLAFFPQIESAYVFAAEKTPFDSSRRAE